MDERVKDRYRITPTIIDGECWWQLQYRWLLGWGDLDIFRTFEYARSAVDHLRQPAKEV